MKQLVVPVTIIVALIAFFVIIDRKEFSRHDDVQTVQRESPTNNRKPSVSVPETKPVTDSKPLTEANPIETKPAETKPVIETKPTEVKPVETKPAETRPVAETMTDKPAETMPVIENKSVTDPKPANKLAPEAIPVLTQEEATKANEEALAYFDVLLMSVRTKDSDLNILEGKIKSISQCPDPQTIDYPDCNLTISVILNDNDHTEIVLFVPCIRDSRIILSHSIKEGTIIRFRIMNASEVSEDEKSIQTVDDILNFKLDYFYVDYVIPINAFSEKTKYIKKRPIKDYMDARLILSDNDILEQKEYIKNELERLNWIIDSFSYEDAQLFKDNLHKIWGTSEDVLPYIAVDFNDTNNKPQTKFYTLVFSADATPNRYLDSALSINKDRIFKNAQAIASIKEWFEKKGIHLIVIPVPQYPEAFVDRFNLSNHLSSYNIDRIFLMKYLLEMDVETLDIEPQIEKSVSSSYYYHNHPKGDYHFRPAGDYYFARHIYDHLNRYEFLQKIIQNDYASSVKWVSYSTSYQGIAFSDMIDANIQSDVNALTDNSPILLIGDSFSATTLRRTLAHVFNTRITAISRGGGAPAMANVLQANEKSIPEESKICFFVFYSMYLNRDFRSIVKQPSESKDNNPAQ